MTVACPPVYCPIDHYCLVCALLQHPVRHAHLRRKCLVDNIIIAVYPLCDDHLDVRVPMYGVNHRTGMT